MNHASGTKAADNNQSARNHNSGQQSFFAAPIQAKLTVNPSNDRYEREADNIADQVVQQPSTSTFFSSVTAGTVQQKTNLAAGIMRMPQQAPVQKCAECEKEKKQQLNSHISVQRKCAECEKKESLQRKENVPSVIQTKSGEASQTSDALTSSIQGSRGKGGGLDKPTQSFMESRFGADFSSVNIHTGSEARHMNSQLNAKAFTVGKDIYFNEGAYQPNSNEGKHLLAHELTHVVQQDNKGTTLQKKPDPVIVDADTPGFEVYTMLKPKATTKENLKTLKEIDPGVQRLLVLNGRRLNIYDAKDKLLKSFVLKDTIIIPYYFYYIVNDLFYIVIVDSNGNVALQGKRQAVTDEEKKMEKQLNDAFSFDNWFEKTEDGKEFLKIMGQEQASMVSMAAADKNSSTPQEKDGPVLSVNYPDWFKELKSKIEALIAEERTANKDNPHLPDKIFFYGSDKVQIQKGTDAWTIEVEKGERESYLTVTKAQWEAAEDKDAYAKQTLQHLYGKVQLMADEAALKKEEQKEINQIDGTGEKAKGSKWGWAVKLKKAIEDILTEKRKTETEAKDFPDKLSISIAEATSGSTVHLRIWVYKEKKDAQPGDLPELTGGTIPTALSEGDKAENWVPVVRKLAAAIRTGNITTDPEAAKSDGGGQTGGDPNVRPAYPALIYAYDMNADHTTATIASNTFRMVVDTAAVHGSNMLNLATIHMGMNIYYSWKIFPLPEALKQLRLDPNTPQPQYLQSVNDYTKQNKSSLGDAKDSYDNDFDWEQEIDMEDIGEGEFLLMSKAAIAYDEDWNIKRQASVAGLAFTVKKAEDLAKQHAMADIDAIAKMKEEANEEPNADRKKLMEDQIAELEKREKTDLLTLTSNDAAETRKLIKKAGELKKFIKDDRARKIPFSGSKDHDPFMFRLKAFDKELYSLYVLVRQIFDYSYEDITAIDEYTKVMEQQATELDKMKTRVGRMTDNENLRSDMPLQRCVAALVKEEDGNVIPITLMVGHHEDSDPVNGKYKMMVLDVTFDSKKGDMTYVGGTESSEKDAIYSAFVEFGHDNKYGDGKVVYRVAGTSFNGTVDSDTDWTEYLGYALAAIGIALLIAGAVLSGGLLAPAAAAAVGGVVTALGIGVAVAGAALAARNIYKRVEKGTFELDAEFAIDIVSIIGAFVQVVGTAGRLMTTMSRTMGAIQRTMAIQRLDKLLLIYDAVELGGNAVLVGLKVHEDVAAIKELNLPKEQEDEMMQQVAMEAIQSGAMLAFASFSKIKDVSEHLTARIERSRYKSFKERGWIDETGKPTDMAPPFMQKAAAEPGKLPGKPQQGEQAWKETQVMDMSVKPTTDRQHKITITERGRIIRCSEFCSDLRMKYGEVLEQDPFINQKMTELEARAQAAAKSGNKQEAENVAKAAVDFEAELKQADDLRVHLFGMTDEEIDDAVDAATAGHVSGGAKSGHKIDDTRIPRRQRRQIDVTDIMTDEELKALGKGGYKQAMDRINVVMGKKISDIPELKAHWDSARADLLKGKAVTDFDKATVIGMYKDAQRKFWANVRKDPKAVEFLKKQGFEFEGDSGAPMAVLGSKGQEATTRGNLTNQERRISLDHIEEKAQGENWQKALDGDNLELMFQNANSWKEIVQVKFGMREEVN